MGLLLLSPTLFLQMNCSCYAPVQAWQALTAQYNTWVKRAAFAWQMLYHTQSVRQQNLSHGCSVIGKVYGFHTGVKRARDLAAYLNQISRAMGSRRQRFRVYQLSNHKGTAAYEEITGKMGKKTTTLLSQCIYWRQLQTNKALLKPSNTHQSVHIVCFYSNNRRDKFAAKRERIQNERC